MPQHPSGTVTFLFSEIEDISRLWEQNAPAMKVAVPMKRANFSDRTPKRSSVSRAGSRKPVLGSRG